MALIDSYQLTPRKVDLNDRIASLVVTSALMLFDRIKPGGKHSQGGMLGLHAPMSYPQAFFFIGLPMLGILEFTLFGHK